jgi:hypothetical protein
MIGVVRIDEDAAGALDDSAGAFPLLRCVGVAWPWFVPEAGAGEEGAGASGVPGFCDGLLGVGEGEGAGVGVGCRDEAGGGADDAGGAGVGVLAPPVPLAACRLPLCMYSSTPSRPSPRLKADDRAKSAKMARSHEFRNISGVVECRVVVWRWRWKREGADVVEVPCGSFTGATTRLRRAFQNRIKGCICEEQVWQRSFVVRVKKKRG